jgi:hypothetical protein
MEAVTILPTEQYNALVSKIDTLHGVVLTMGDQLLNATSKWMTTKQVCEHLSKSENWVLLHKHELGCSKRAGTLLFKRADVDAFIESDYFKKK